MGIECPAPLEAEHLVTDWAVDTTVLSNFAMVGRPDLLVAASDGVVTACPAVLRELHAGEEQGRVPTCDWSAITMVGLTREESRLVSLYPAALGAGEAESLAVAEKRGLVLLTDDAVARRMAKRRGVVVSGTIGVLRRLWELDQLTADEADDLYEEMKRRGFRGPPGSLRSFLQ